MGEEFARALQIGRNHIGHRFVKVIDVEKTVGLARENPPKRFQVCPFRGLVEGDAQMVGIDHTQVYACLQCLGGDSPGLARHVKGDGVEEGLIHRIVTQEAQAFGHDLRHAVHTPRDQLQTVGTVIGRIEAGDDGKQNLSGADIAGRLLAPNMLLSGLQGHAQRRFALAIDRNTDNTPRNGALVDLARGEERGMRPAIPHWNAETLGTADDDIGPHLAGRLEQAEAQDVNRDNRDGFIRFSGCNNAAHVLDHTAGAGVLHQNPEALRGHKFTEGIAGHDLDVQCLGTGLDHRDGLGMAVGGDEEAVRLAFADTRSHGHGLGRRCRFIEQ